MQKSGNFSKDAFVQGIETKLRELYMLSLQGDQIAYEEFLNLCSVEIKRALFFMKGKFSSAENLEDLHQEILLKVHHKKHTYRTDYPILPWLKAIVRYSFIDFYRSSKKTPSAVELKDFLLVEEEVSSDLDELLGILSPAERKLVEQIKIENKSYREVARQFDVSETALKTRFHRIMKALKQKARP